jgi:hypothetical protein
VAFAVTDAHALIRFDTAAPGTIQRSVPVTGLDPADQVRDVDFRPATGQLYALSVRDTPGPDEGRIYRIDPATGAATALGATPFSASLADGAAYGMDVNPKLDHIRIVNSADQNFRVNARTGALIFADVALDNSSGSESVLSIAYSDNFAGPAWTGVTTLYGIDAAAGSLVRLGAVDAAGKNGLDTPDGGQVSTVGTIPFDLGGGPVAFDFGSVLDGAYLTAAVGGQTSLYRIDPTGGAATLVGPIGDGQSVLRGLSVAPRSVRVTGTDVGGGPHVRVYDGATGELQFDISAYDPAFRGGVRVASGDVNRDGVPDVITAPGPGGGPHVRVFSGVDGAPLGGPVASFLAYESDFRGGLTVAAGDVNGDGFSDIITGTGAGGGPLVKVFSGADGSLLSAFFAYVAAFRGGVNVTAGDLNGDLRADIVTGAGVGGGPHVRSFDGSTFSPFPNNAFNFFPYDPAFRGGVSVAVGDLDGDGRADVITAPGAGGGPHVRAFSGATGGSLANFLAYDARFTGGVRVAAIDVNGDGRQDLVTAPGRGGHQVRAFAMGSGNPPVISSFSPYDPAFLGGVFVGGSRC